MPNSLSLSQYATAGEGRAARKLIRAALAQGYAVSVNDGEETTVRRSKREREIIDALCTTGEDYVILHLPDSGERAGSFYLVYGNDDDGSELIADHTDNATCDVHLVSVLSAGLVLDLSLVRGWFDLFH